MDKRLRRMREDRAAGDHGFTLIEMLVVVVIIGILAAISIPLYLNYRKGAENKSAESDVRGSITAVEQFYTENGNAYPLNPLTSGVGANLVFPAVGVGGVAQTATVSPGNTLSYRYVPPAGAVTSPSYILCARNASGGVSYVYNSSTGRPVGKSTQATLAACVANGN